jgi:hypothetical protein
MAKRMGATTIEIKASHLSLISQPTRSRADPGSREEHLRRAGGSRQRLALRRLSPPRAAINLPK